MQVATHNTQQTYLVLNSVDPTRTTVLRNAFASDMDRRFNEIVKVINKSVVTNDCFGLNLSTNALTPLPERSLIFARSGRKVTAFMEWLRRQEEDSLLKLVNLQQIGTGVDNYWTNMYIYDSYKRGIIRARQEIRNEGGNVPTTEQTGGVDISTFTPMHIDRLGLVFTRTFTGLKGITDAMDLVISQILAQGIADGDNPRKLAKKLVDAINGEVIGDLGIRDSLGRYISPRRRAELLARTEIIRAHHIAMIQEYKNWGILGVKVKAEFRTAGDNRVCPRCSGLQGQIFTLEQAENIIPVHPLCRCICLPYIERA